MFPKLLLLAGFFWFSIAVKAAPIKNRLDSVPLGKTTDIFKINVTSLFLKNISVQYEYMLSRKISVALGGRMMPSTAIPFKGLAESLVAEDDEDTKEVINKTRLSNIAITPEVRFYLGKGYGEGFYIAPYYRFVRFSSNTGIINYSDPNGGPKRSVQLNGDLNAHNGGIMLGLQKFLGKNFVLDWWIVGGHFGKGSGVFTGTPNQPITAAEQADIRQTLDNIDIPLINKTYSVTANNVTVNFNGAFGGLRSGLCLGIRFAEAAAKLKESAPTKKQGAF